MIYQGVYKFTLSQALRHVVWVKFVEIPGNIFWRKITSKKDNWLLLTSKSKNSKDRTRKFLYRIVHRYSNLFATIHVSSKTLTGQNALCGVHIFWFSLFMSHKTAGWRNCSVWSFGTPQQWDKGWHAEALIDNLQFPLRLMHRHMCLLGFGAHEIAYVSFWIPMMQPSQRSNHANSKLCTSTHQGSFMLHASVCCHMPAGSLTPDVQFTLLNNGLKSVSWQRCIVGSN